MRWSAPHAPPDRGFWFPPTMFTAVSQEHRIAREELFWPVLTVSSFPTPDEVVERTNSTPYGLSAGVWTRQGALSAWLAARLRAGVVWVNSFGGFDPAVPFGGYQESGFGREGGRHGLEAYLDLPGAWSARCLRRRPIRSPRPPRAAAAHQTYRLYIGGAFPRAASGRTFEVHGADGGFLASAALAAERDARDAVVAARGAFPGWSRAAGYHRGQALYRVAEVMEGHRGQFAAQLRPGRRRLARGGLRRGGRGGGPLDLVRGLGGQAHPGARHRQPGGGTVRHRLAARAGRRDRRARPAGQRAARPGQRARPGDRQRQHRGAGRQRALPAARGRLRRGRWPRPGCRRGW